MYNQSRFNHTVHHGGRQPPSIPMAAINMHQWPQQQLPVYDTTAYGLNPMPMHALAPVPNIMPGAPDSDSIVIPVVVSRTFNVPPPVVFPTKSQYLAQSQEAWGEPCAAEPSNQQHTLSLDAPEFVPSSQRAYNASETHQATSSENHSAVLSVSGNHHNAQYQRNPNKHQQDGYYSQQEHNFSSAYKGSQDVQSQHKYHKNATKHQQDGYYSQQENHYSSAYRGVHIGRHHNANPINYYQKRGQESTSSDGMIKTKRDTNKIASKRPPWSDVPQRQTQGKEASESQSQQSSQILLCMPSIHSRDEPSPHVENEMFKLNVQNEVVHDSRSGQKNFRFPAHQENAQSIRLGNSHRGRPFNKYNNNYHPAYHNQGDPHSYGGSYPGYYPHTASPEEHYSGFSLRTQEFTNHSRRSGMQTQPWVQQPNYTNSAYRGNRFNHQGEREAREPYNSELYNSKPYNSARGKHCNSNAIAFNQRHFEEELHQNDHRHHYPKQLSQGGSQRDAEFFYSRSIGPKPYSRRENQVLDNESLDETRSSNDVEPDDDFEDLDHDKSKEPSQDAEQSAEPSKVLELTEIPKYSHPGPGKVEPNIISCNVDVQTVKSDGSPEETKDPASEPIISQDQNKDADNKLSPPRVPDKVKQALDQVKSTPVDMKKEKDLQIEPKAVMDTVAEMDNVQLIKKNSFDQHEDKLKRNESSKNYLDSNRTDSTRRADDISCDGQKWQGKGHDRSGQRRGAASESTHRGRHQDHTSEGRPKATQKNNVVDANRPYRGGRQNADRPGNVARVSVQRSNSDTYSNASRGDRIVYRSANDMSNLKGESRDNLEEKMSKNKMSARQTCVLLDDYNSDLNLIIDASGHGAFTVDAPLGFSKLWADCKATHGVNKGKFYFEVKLMDLIDMSIPEENDQCPNVLRIGWSAENAVFEANTGSWSFGYKDSRGTVKGDAFYETTTKDDVLGAMVNFDVNPVEISYLKNGEAIGQTALFTPLPENSSLFPHISLKNCKVRVNFGQRDSPWYPPPEGFSFIGKSTVSELSHSLSPPVKKSECELIMMIGLPGSGKTTWATQKQEEHRDRRYNILGTDLLVELMSASKNGLQPSDEDLFSLADGCYKRLLTIASMKMRNYILDEINVQASSRAEKLRKFNPFIKRAVIVQPSPRDLELRHEKLSAAGKNVPESELKEMEASFSLPERSEDFKSTEFVGLKEQDAKKLIEKYQDNGHSKSPMLALD